jgi:transglutaminase-like putative cysteine protease
MLLKIQHRTRYRYDDPIVYALQELRMTPKSQSGQKIVSWHVELEGATLEAVFEDQNSNSVILTSANQGALEVIVACSGEVETTNGSGVIGKHGGYAPLWYFTRQTRLTEPGPLVKTLAKEAGSNFSDALSQVHALSKLISDTVQYQTGTTNSSTTAEMALETGRGVCQDHAHILISVARLMKWPARYVSGYLMMNERVEQDAGHAWAEIYLDPLGWVGFDVSNGISPDERYVRVATGLDYRDAAPVSGIHFGNNPGDTEDHMLVEIQVQQ